MGGEVALVCTRIVNDEAVALFVGKVAEQPAEADEYFVAESADGHQVDDGPDEPGEITGEFPLADVGDGALLADGGQGTFVFIDELFGDGLTPDDLGEYFAQVSALLDSHLCHLGQAPGERLAAQAGDVADGEDVGHALDL